MPGGGVYFLGDPIFPVLCANLPSSITSVRGDGPVLACSERRFQPKTVGDSRAKIRFRAAVAAPGRLDFHRTRGLKPPALPLRCPERHDRGSTDCRQSTKLVRSPDHAVFSDGGDGLPAVEESCRRLLCQRVRVRSSGKLGDLAFL